LVLSAFCFDIIDNYHKVANVIDYRMRLGKNIDNTRGTLIGNLSERQTNSAARTAHRPIGRAGRRMKSKLDEEATFKKEIRRVLFGAFEVIMSVLR
jgi:hypothetical protein